MGDIVEDYEGAKKELEAFWPKLLSKIVNDGPIRRLKASKEWLQRLLQINVPDGKKFRGLALVLFYRSFDDSMKRHSTLITDEHLYAMAWALEIYQAACLIADDIVDNSSTRRGKPCWHLMEGRDSAVIDILLLENIASRILDKYFKEFPNYFSIMKLIHKVSIQTLLGEGLDTKSTVTPGQSNNNNVKNMLESFTMKMYSDIVEFKTSYYTFWQPAALAMILVGSVERKDMKAVHDISLQIGHLFQIQDDYLDCYGDPDVTGKIGTDILDGKCTWLIAKSLELASPEQTAQLEEFYGREGYEEKVKQIYTDLNVAQQFNTYEDEAYNEIYERIDNLPGTVPNEHLFHMLNCIYRRNK